MCSEQQRKLQAPSLDWFISYCSRFPLLSFLFHFSSPSYYFRSMHARPYYVHTPRFLRYFLSLEDFILSQLLPFTLLASGHQETMLINLRVPYQIRQ
jgi:hypothetical protein